MRLRRRQPAAEQRAFKAAARVGFVARLLRGEQRVLRLRGAQTGDSLTIGDRSAHCRTVDVRSADPRKQIAQARAAGCGRRARIWNRVALCVYSHGLRSCVCGVVLEVAAGRVHVRIRARVLDCTSRETG